MSTEPATVLEDHRTERTFILVVRTTSPLEIDP